MIDMEFSVQHNGKGKMHLIADESELCGTVGVFLFTCSYYLKFKEGKWFEIFNRIEVELNDACMSEYCKKCVKKAIISLNP